MAIPAGAPDALKPCRQGLCAPGNGGIVMVVRVEGCGLVVVDAQGVRVPLNMKDFCSCSWVLLMSSAAPAQRGTTLMARSLQQGSCCQSEQQTLIGCGHAHEAVKPADGGRLVEVNIRVLIDLLQNSCWPLVALMTFPSRSAMRATCHLAVQGSFRDKRESPGVWAFRAA